MNQTALLHTVFAVLVVAGFFATETALKFGLFGLGGIFFIAGVIAARRGETNTDYDSSGNQ